MNGNNEVVTWVWYARTHLKIGPVFFGSLRQLTAAVQTKFNEVHVWTPKPRIAEIDADPAE